MTTSCNVCHRILATAGPDFGPEAAPDFVVCDECAHEPAPVGAKLAKIGPGPWHFDPLLGTLFDPGYVTMTPLAAAAIGASGENPPSFLCRHLRGDWSDPAVPTYGGRPSPLPNDNRETLKRGFGIVMSYFRTSLGTTIMLYSDITSGGTSTTIMLPEEL